MTDRNQMPFRYIDIGSIDQVEKRIDGTISTMPSAAPSRARQLVRAGDVLVSTVRPNLNAVAIVPDDLDGATASTGFAVLRPSPDTLYGQYLFHWVRSVEFIRLMTSRTTGANYPAVTDAIVRESPIPLPPLPTQRRIAQILDRVDSIRRARTRSDDLLDELIASVFLDHFGDPLRNERRWERLPLGSCLREPPAIGTVTPASTDGSVLLARVGELGAYDLAVERCARVSIAPERAERFTARSGDLLLARAIGSEAHLGKASVVTDTIGPIVFDSHVMRLRVNPDRLRSAFLWYWLRSPGGRHLFMKQSRRTAVQFNINSKQLGGLPIPLPPVEKQDEFLRVANVARQTRRTFELSSTSIEHVSQSLRHRAFI